MKSVRGPRVSEGWLTSYLLTKSVIKITRKAMMAGATEKIIIQIASFLNVNLSSFMFLPLGQW
jgi:hypothetical protein